MVETHTCLRICAHLRLARLSIRPPSSHHDSSTAFIKCVLQAKCYPCGLLCIPSQLACVLFIRVSTMDGGTTCTQQ
eukprot:1839026-Pleurochrysis_carterae.AAC.1